MPTGPDGDDLVRCSCARRDGRVGLITYRRGDRTYDAPCPDCKGTTHPGQCLPYQPVITIDLTSPPPETP